MTKSHDHPRVATNLRTLLILEALSDAGHALTPTEINRHVGLPKQSIHRLCTTLVRQGFLALDIDKRRLMPTARLQTLAMGLSQVAHVDIARHQILQSVAREIGETVNFVLPQEQGMIYRDRVETDWPLRIQLPIGSHVPFHCTASGKTFLASLAPAPRTALLNCLSLEKHAHNSITDTQVLQRALECVRRDGYAVDDEEFKDGMVALAVPICDSNAKFIAAIAFHAPIQRIDANRVADFLPVLQRGAKLLSALFFPAATARSSANDR